MATLAEVLRQAGYVTPQGQVVGPRTDLAQKLKSYVMNIPQNAAQNLANQRADIDAALTMGQGGIQIGDREAFARQMAEVPNLMGAIAYHGTPHTIKGKFDISKVGTGEGAQAYGHGMYFAENPAVAQAYKTAGETIKYTPTVQKFTSGANYYIDDAGNYMKVRDWVKNDKPTPVPKEEYLQKFNEIKKMYELQPQGNLYKVDIPDEYIPNMLDWDKPLNQQSDVVKKALGLPEDKFAGFKVPITGTNYSFSPNMTAAEFYKELTDLAKTQAGASEMLNSMGIKGIRYLDEGSRSSGKGTSNFVVFDPSEVKILEQNSKPITRKEIIEQELEKVSK